MEIIIFLLTIIVFILIMIAIQVYLNSKKIEESNNDNTTPKLSELERKEFKSYMEDLHKDLH
ncbi:MAG: hypothetical protein J6I85_00105 [Clostridia bacterium]|nr:hypothetical protein [Clostridia bacterium]